MLTIFKISEKRKEANKTRMNNNDNNKKIDDWFGMCYGRYYGIKEKNKKIIMLKKTTSIHIVKVKSNTNFSANLR